MKDAILIFDENQGIHNGPRMVKLAVRYGFTLEDGADLYDLDLQEDALEFLNDDKRERHHEEPQYPGYFEWDGDFWFIPEENPTSDQLLPFVIPGLGLRRGGAPMGRNNTINRVPPMSERVFDRKLRFVDGDYDQGGAYWGRSNKPIRVRFSKDLEFILFYRSWTKISNIDELREHLPSYKQHEIPE